MNMRHQSFLSNVFQRGRVLMYFLISFLAVNNDLQFFISSGASFQILAASLMKVDSAILDLPTVLSNDLSADLRFLAEKSSLFVSH